MPKKLFAAGEVLRAADVNQYLTTSRNVIINGAFEVNQRAFSSRTTDGYGFDRWTLVTGGNTTYSAQSFTPGAAPVAGFEARNFARLVTTSQNATTGYAILGQPIEDVRTFAGQTVTVSFYARAESGTPKVAVEFLQSFGTGGSPSSLVTISGSAVTINTNWNKYSVTVNIPSISGKTIGTDANSSSLIAYLWVSAGSNFNARASSIGAQNNTFDIWGVQVEEGSVATEFHRNANSIQGELAACQRYYFRINAEGNAGIFGDGLTFSSTAGYVNIRMPVTMRTAPSVLDFSGSFVINNGAAQYLIGGFIMPSNITNSNTASLGFAATSAPGTPFSGRVLAQATTNFIGFSAEL